LMKTSACSALQPALDAELERLVAFTVDGDCGGAEVIVGYVASELIADLDSKLTVRVLPPIMDVWFYIRQDRCDLAVEYAVRALQILKTFSALP
jgi:hypothetical protein